MEDKFLHNSQEPIGKHTRSFQREPAADSYHFTSKYYDRIFLQHRPAVYLCPLQISLNGEANESKSNGIAI